MIYMHYITLYVMDIHNVRCLGPSLPLYDHFEIWRFGTELAVLAETLSGILMGHPPSRGWFHEFYLSLSLNIAWP